MTHAEPRKPPKLVFPSEAMGRPVSFLISLNAMLKRVANMVGERTWHTSQQITDLPNGCARLHLRLSALEEIERWILSWGTHASVIKPQILAQRVSAICRTLARRYHENR